ncbi:unnamed protein product [Ceutorhynchus assimilis]|uniref:Uncharacterized protein n=1 Tax=Ceutorhynchus assimilis TaxID=467358 RepID=A0A9N9QNY4_9CUCU|nr:unnamed protein product [Ceutorhynchus assimilis]
MPYIILLTTIILLITSTIGAPTFLENDRQTRNLAYFDYIQPEINYGPYEALTNEDDYDESIEENELSRTVPARKRLRNPQYNSPIYYIRLPPQPYMFVPGLGYVSQPPPNPVSQFVNIPVSFVSNGKPNGIYQWTGGIDIPTAAPPSTTPKPKPRPAKKPLKPDSNIHRIPGQFTFNGRPEDIFVLRDSNRETFVVKF